MRKGRRKQKDVVPEARLEGDEWIPKLTDFEGSKDEKRKIGELLNDYKDVFSRDEFDVGC